VSAQHTPGPWDNNRSLTIVANECGTLIATLPDDDTNEQETLAQEANACLIAAAPDLLAALIELCIGHSMIGEAQGRAAIARATGGEGGQ
jgi:hypothetical protein